MIRVAWHQQDGVLVTIGELTASCNLTTIIDEDGIYQCDVRTGRNQGLQVNGGTAILGQERMVFVKTVCRSEAYDLSLRIDRIGGAARFTVYCAEIDNGSVFPENRVEKRSAIRLADDLARVIDPVCKCQIPAWQ